MPKKNQRISIYFSEEDLQELQAGETFDWAFPTEKGEWIDVFLFQGVRGEKEVK